MFRTKTFLIVLLHMAAVEALIDKLPASLAKAPLILEKPLCHAYNTLCHISMNVTIGNSDTVAPISDEKQLCECPGDVKCPVNDVTSDRTVQHKFQGIGETFHLKMSFCQLELPTRKCNKNEPVVTLKGGGPMMIGTFGDFKCRCKRVLYAHRSWTEGSFDFIQYSCGKPLCHRIHPEKNDNPVCMTVTNQKRTESSFPYYGHSYICRCRYFQECRVAGGLPSVRGKMAYAFCQDKSVSYIHKLS